MSEWTATEPNGPGWGWRAGPAWLGQDASSDETRRDAYLIAAAPDLLAACEVLLDAVARGDHKDKALRTARAAIAKARGK